MSSSSAFNVDRQGDTRNGTLRMKWSECESISVLGLGDLGTAHLGQLSVPWGAEIMPGHPRLQLALVFKCSGHTRVVGSVFEAPHK